MKERIIFYSKRDLSCVMSLERIEKFLSQVNLHGVVCDNLTDAIELYNITLFFNYNLYLNSWSEVDIDNYKTQVKTFYGIIGKYLASLTVEQCVIEYDALPYDYKYDIFGVIDIFKCKNLFDEVLISHILLDLPHQIKYLLKHRKLVERFDACLTTYLMDSSLTVEMIIEKYYNESTDEEGILYFPPSFDKTKMSLALNHYLDSEDANMNVVYRIAVAGKADGFEMEPTIRIKAKHCYKQKKKELLSNANTCVYKTSVAYSKNQVEQCCYKANGLDLMLTFSAEYIINCDEVQHIHNFRNYLEMLDSKGRITLVNNPSYNIFLDDIESRTHKKCFYETNLAFEYQHQLIKQGVASYREFLKRYTPKRLEEILGSFYNERLRDEFNYPTLPMNIPLESDLYANKNKILAPEFERVLRQHDLFVQYHEINEELLSYVDYFSLSSVKSVVDKKYAYLKSEQNEWQVIMNLMFSSQSGLALMRLNVDGCEHTRSFYELLRKNTQIPFSCVVNYQEKALQFLIDKGFLKVEEGCFMMNNVETWYVLKELYNYQVLPYWYYNPAIQKIIDTLAAQGVLEFDNHLFSRREIDYLSYWLNAQYFSNGLQLRNKYMHGMYAVQDEKEHEDNYCILLMLLLIIVLKIEDDLCTAKFLRY